MHRTRFLLRYVCSFLYELGLRQMGDNMGQLGVGGCHYNNHLLRGFPPSLPSLLTVVVEKSVQGQSFKKKKKVARTEIQGQW